jgi:hypothetical protein
MESHDEERVNYKNNMYGNSYNGYNIRDTNISPKRVEMATAFLFLSPGPRMIYQFGELGYDLPINLCENGTINNNCRTEPKPLRWNYFQDQERNHLYHVMADLNRIRNHSVFGSVIANGTVNGQLADLRKWMSVSHSGKALLVAGNFDLVDKVITVNFPFTGKWYDYFAADSLQITGNSTQLLLKPGEYRVYLSQRLLISGKLLKFTGSGSGNNNLLNWQPINEGATAHYVLERSSDPAGFYPVYQVAANGSGSYDFVDDISLLSQSEPYYRLRIYDSTGDFRFSNIIKISRSSIDELEVKAENPFSGSFRFGFNVPEAGFYEWRITDMVGRRLHISKADLGKGWQEFQINEAASWASGTYILQVAGVGRKKTVKLIRINNR